MTNDVQIDEVSGVVTQAVAVVAAPVTLTGLTVDVLTAHQLVDIGDLVTFSYTPSATEGGLGEWRIESVTGNVGTVDGDVGDVTGNVGDVTGDVGDVGGDVGNVDGDVCSVNGSVENGVGGDVGSVDGSVGDIGGDCGNVSGSVENVDGDVGDVGGSVGDIGGDCGEVSGSVGSGGNTVDSDFWDDLNRIVESIQKLIKDNCND